MRKSVKKIVSALIGFTLLTSCASNANDVAKKDEEKTTISISVYAKNEYLEKSAEAYMKENPNVTINISTYDANVKAEVSDSMSSFLDLGDLESYEIYIKNMDKSYDEDNTPDIIAMDVIPYYKYSNKGYLKDYKELIENDKSFKSNEHYEGLLTGMEVNGHLYTMPTDYEGYMCGTNKNYIKTTENGHILDAIDEGALIISQYSGGDFYLYKDVYSLFKILYEEEYPNLINLAKQEAYFDSDTFVSILSKCKEWENRDIVLLEESKNPDVIYYLEYDSLWSEQLLNPYLGIEIDYEGLTLARDTNNNAYFTSPHALSISSKSKNVEASWEFIKYLISDEAQTEFQTYPLNKKTLNNSYKDKALNRLQVAKENGTELSESPRRLANDYIDQIYVWSDELTGYHFKDATVELIVRAEAEKYFADVQDRDTTVNNIQTKVTEYLNE